MRWKTRMGLGVLAMVVGLLGVGVGSAAAQNDPHPPASPVTLTLPAVVYDQLAISWMAGNTGTVPAASFEVGYAEISATSPVVDFSAAGVTPIVVPVIGGAGAIQHVIVGLKGGTRYVVGVRSVSAVVAATTTTPGFAAMRSIWVFPPTPPTETTNEADPPTAVDHRTIEVDPGDTQLEVEWLPSQNTGGTGLTITDYDIRYWTGTATNTAMAETFPHVGTATTATITGLTNGTMYYIQIRATNSGASVSPWSTAVMGTPKPDGTVVLPATAPEVMKYASCTLLQVDWSKGVAKAGGTYSTAWNANEIATYEMNTDLDRDKDMVACETGGEAMPPGQLPTDGTPAKVVINPVEKANIKATSIMISWNAVGSGSAPLIGYQIQYMKTGGVAMPLMETAQRMATISGLTAATAYQIRVRGRNQIGNGVWSAYTMVTTAAAGTTQTPGAGPAKMAVPMVKPGVKMLTVSWTAPASAKSITHYEVRYRAATATVWEPAPPKAAMTVTAMMTEIKPLVDGTAYLVQVRAVDSAGDKGVWSDSGSETPMADAVPTPALPLFGAFGLGAGLLAIGRARMRRQAQLRGRREQRQMTR